MFKNFIKVAWRNLLRNKGFSIINISGLAIGMAATILILLWIQSEVSFEQFHKNKDRIYEAWTKAIRDGVPEAFGATPGGLARTLEKDYADVEMAVRVRWSGDQLSVGNNKFRVYGVFVDSGFLKMFSFPLIKGDINTVLNDANSITLTESMAKKLFGKEDPIGKIVQTENHENFTVNGILKDVSNNTRFQFDYLISWAYLKKIGQDNQVWGNYSTITYVMLKPNANVNNAQAIMKDVYKKNGNAGLNEEMFLYPMSRWHLYASFKNGVEEGGKIETVRLFSIIAAFIILIACINFMNLSTARSEKRAKEVGIRKVVGAQKKLLVVQFIFESVLLAIIAGIISIIIVQLCLPAFNDVIGKKVSIDYGNINYWIAAIVFILFTGLLAGCYPAFYLSSFQPVKILKGLNKKAHALITPRKILVVLQFTFAIILIIGTIIVKQQVQHAQNRAIGYSKDNLIYHAISDDIAKNYALIKNELITQGVATSVSKTMNKPTQVSASYWGVGWQGKDPNDKTNFILYSTDENLTATTGLEIIKGRDFNLKEYPTDSTGIILNETALNLMKFSNPVGQPIKLWDSTQWHVVGVVKDFIIESPYEPVKPMIIIGASAYTGEMLIKMNGANSVSDNLSKAEAIFKKYNPNAPFEYGFVDKEYERKFENEKRIGTLASLFAFLTIFISCLGLFGLATYMAENRIKEIGVRKVLGASVTNITALLSKDFLKLVIISFIIASPIAWWAMNKWLQAYAYRVQIHWWVFALAAFLAIVISLATVSYQSIKAALSNPVNSLRTE